MSFKGILDDIGNDAKKVFAFLGSPAGQKDVAVVEGAVDTAVAAVAPTLLNPIEGVQTLINNWLAEAFKVQALAAAAGATTGSDTTKEAAALSTMEPQVMAFLQTQGYSTAQVATEASTVNTAIVTILNVLGSAGKTTVQEPSVAPQPPAQA